MTLPPLERLPQRRPPAGVLEVVDLVKHFGPVRGGRRGVSLSVDAGRGGRRWSASPVSGKTHPRAAA